MFVCYPSRSRCIRVAKHVTVAISSQITRHAFSRPELIMRWNVNPRDVIMWDNRATMHLAPVGLPLLGTSRVVHRVTCKGQPFLSAHGQTSRIVSGVPILAAREEIERGMV